MKYEKVIEAKFLERPNRFIARVNINDREETVHVKNTGRCRELLIPGATVFLNEFSGGSRKTKYDLVAVLKETEDGKQKLINIDSQAPNEAVGEWLPKSGLFSENAKIRREVSFGISRFDFAVTEESSGASGEEKKEKTTFVEVKGVTLESGGRVMFPDAPTERGAKHLRELSRLRREGYGAIVIFVVQMNGAVGFLPNSNTDKAFAEALFEARKSGVEILVYDCFTAPDEMTINQPIKLLF